MFSKLQPYKDLKFIGYGLLLFILVAKAYPLPLPDHHCSDLQSWYTLYNDSYFDELPDANVYESTDTDGAEGETALIDGKYVIKINPKLDILANQEHETLLHEMCHVATWDREKDDHGPIWYGCMLNVAKQGGMEDLW